MNRKTREELNQMSKEVFGTSSRWQKIVNMGVAEPLERNREVLVPLSRGRGIEKKIYTDKKSVTRRYTVEEVQKLMEDILVARKADQARIDAITAATNTITDLPEGFPKGSTVEISGVPGESTVV